MSQSSSGKDVGLSTRRRGFDCAAKGGSVAPPEEWQQAAILQAESTPAWDACPCSSAGRAPPRYGGGRRFNSDRGLSNGLEGDALGKRAGLQNQPTAEFDSPVPCFGTVAKWSGDGLQPRRPRFDSGRYLYTPVAEWMRHRTSTPAHAGSSPAPSAVAFFGDLFYYNCIK